MNKSIAFVCVGNSCRSQIAEGFAKQIGGDILDVYSAGTHPADKVDSNAVEVMKEVGIDISMQYPKLLDAIPFEVDILIKMGCEVVCPIIENDREEDWQIEDPVGKPIEEFRRIREIIRQKVTDIVKDIKMQMN